MRRFRVRDTERGVLEDQFAVRHIWTLHAGAVVSAWLVIRAEGGEPTYLNFAQMGGRMLPEGA